MNPAQTVGRYVGAFVRRWACAQLAVLDGVAELFLPFRFLGKQGYKHLVRAGAAASVAYVPDVVLGAAELVLYLFAAYLDLYNSVLDRRLVRLFR